MDLLGVVGFKVSKAHAKSNLSLPLTYDINSQLLPQSCHAYRPASMLPAMIIIMGSPSKIVSHLPIKPPF